MLSRLDQPDRQDLKALRESLEQLPLIGPDRHAWDDEIDLVAVHQLDRRDSFSKFALHTIIPFFHNVIDRYFKVGLS